MNQPMLLQAHQLSRRFHGHPAVQDISLTLQKGEIVGLLGPNGAGKSTLLQMLAGVLAPSAGTLHVTGQNPYRKVTTRKQIGYLPEHPPLYPDFRVREQLEFAGQLQQVEQRQQHINEALQQCELQDVEKRLIRHLSKGMRHRVGLAQVILHQPSLLLLDEPTDGLDPLQTQNFQQLIQSLKKQAGVIISTHHLGEVKALCGRILILQKGRLQVSATLADLEKNGDTLEQIFTRLMDSEQPTAA